MKVQASLDFCYNMQLQHFFKLIDKYNAVLVGFVAEGPAGGNPCVTLEFRSMDEALTYLREAHYPDDTEEFHRTLCDPVLPTFLVPNV